MVTLKHGIFGYEFGNFRPTHQSRRELLEKINKVFSETRPALIYGLKANFTTHIDVFKDDEPWNMWFSRSKDDADGGILINKPNVAIAIFNGDCPVICLHEDQKLAVLHGGYRCLVRANRDELGILELALQHFKPSRTKAYVFGGIGSCCWVPEYDDKPEILKPELSRRPDLLKKSLSMTTAICPFGADKVSVDLYELIKLQLEEHSVEVTMNKTCTCCAMNGPWYKYWSHTRFQAGKQEKLDGRNMAIAWLE